jgi:type IV pilus modification protein PilV
MKRFVSSHKFSKLRSLPKRGISLLESLIAIIVFAVGMLGLGGMYLFALKSQSDAKSRSAITAFSAAMMDRIAANANTAINNSSYDRDYAAVTTNNALCATYRQGDAYSSRPAFANAMTPANLAAAELAEFVNEVACALPGGEVDIKANLVPTPGQPPCTAPMIAANGLVTIRIRWQDNRSDAQTGGDNTNRYECYNTSARVN